VNAISACEVKTDIVISLSSIRAQASRVLVCPPSVACRGAAVVLPHPHWAPHEFRAGGLCSLRASRRLA
jgi:hypothetical protein